MQPNLQHADPHADPHDAIAAQLRDLAPRIAEDPSGPSIAPAASPETSPEPSFHAAPLNDNTGESLDLTSRTGPRRGTLIVIVCAGIAAAVAWHTYADAAKQQISHLVPQLIPAALVPAQTPSAEPQSETAQAATPQPASDVSNAQDASAAPTESGATAPAAAAQNTTAPDAALLIENITREIASLKQTVEQLQAGQQQLSRDIAKINEQEARRKVSAQAPKPVSRPQAPPQRPVAYPVVSSRTPAPYPAPTSPRAQIYPQGPAQRDAYVAPPPPTQLPPQPGDTSVPRPPLPLR